MKLKELICRIFGHKISMPELWTLKISQKAAINKEDFKDRYIICPRCNKKITFYNDP
jgi:hypothetical protein